MTPKTTNARTRAREARSHIVDAICRRIATGQSVAAVCRDKGMPSVPTFWRWLSEDRELVAKYELALTMRAHILAEELVAIADDASNDVIVTEDGPQANVDHIMRTKLRVNTRQWVLSRLLPQRYGDRVRQEVTGAGGGPIQTESVVADIRAGLERIREKMRQNIEAGQPSPSSKPTAPE